MYGQTEATARLTYVPPERLHDKQGSVGIPIRGVELQILDEHLQTLHSPEAGDIWVRGPSVMLGYWKDEAATREVLTDGWLKTGDTGYLDSDGFLFLVGRRSDIIKTGAHRVNPIEVEETIADIPGVVDTGVAAIDDNILGQSIAAYIVIAPEHDITIERIKAHCRERMAAYKVPKQVYFVDSLPRTASGKLRRIELSSAPTKQGTKGIH
jgi:acyl-CoA synthetase (AMP-forming)/AMP-acid ligase II